MIRDQRPVVSDGFRPAKMARMQGIKGTRHRNASFFGQQPEIDPEGLDI
jgi:hypothetical protein